MTVKIIIKEDKITLKLSILNRLASLSGDFTISPKHVQLPIRKAPPEATKLWKGVKVGTHIPMVYTAANFYHVNDQRDFYFFTGNVENTIAIDLVGHPTHKLVVVTVEEEDVDTVIERINQAVRDAAKD